MIREMRLIVYFVVGLLMSINSVFAFAESVSANINFMAGSNVARSGGAVCASLGSGAQYADASPYQYAGTWYVGWCSIDGNNVAQVKSNGDCNGIGGELTGTYPSWMCTCPAGTKPSNGTCVKGDPCEAKAGQSLDDGSVDFGDGGNKKLSMSFPDRADSNYTGQSFCSGGCKAVVDKEVGSSGMTVEGYYYGQFSAKFSGLSCESGQAEVSTKTTPALIPKNSPEYDCVSKGMGYGFVNGAVKCVAKTSSKEKETKSSETTKADGSKTKETKTDNTVCTAGVCTTTTTTITTEYNSSGTVTGTSTKTDTVTKADPNSGLGSGGVKDYQPGTECGVSGKPPCGVKVDETGVSTDVSAMNQTALDKFTAVFDEVRQKMEEVTRPKVWGLTWNYAVPSGSCSVLQYGVRSHQFSLDICKPLGFVRDLWSYVIYVMTGLYIWRSARDAMNVV